MLLKFHLGFSVSTAQFAHIGSKESYTMALIIFVGFREEYVFFYFCKKFRTIEQDEKNKDMFLLAKYTC